MDATQTTSVAAVQASYSCKAAAIVAITTSGRTARLCSKFRPHCPIIGVTRFPQVARQMQLHRGIIPIYYKGIIRSGNAVENQAHGSVRLCTKTG